MPLHDGLSLIHIFKFRLGLFQKPYIPNYFIDRRAHEKRARELAAECMVLLKNNGHVLPLSKDSRVALIGPMAKERASLLGSWSLDGEETDVVSLYDGMCAAAGMDKIEVSPNDLYDEGLMHICLLYTSNGFRWRAFPGTG